MNLSSESAAIFDQLLATAQLADINKMIIAEGQIRAIDEKKQVVIITNTNVPDFNGLSVGLNRIPALVQRVNALKKLENFVLDVKASDKNPTEVEMITVNAKKSKAQFRCASPEFIKGVPKGINDVWKYKIPVVADAVALLQQGIGMMSASTVKIVGEGGTVKFEVADGTRDVFSHEFGEVVLGADDEPVADTFTYEYPSKVFLSLMKRATADGATLMTIGEKGICQLTVNTFPVMVLPITG